MNKSEMLRYVNLPLALSFLIQAGTALIIFSDVALPNKKLLFGVHEYNGLFLITLLCAAASAQEQTTRPATLSLITGDRRSATATTSKPTQLLVLDIADFRDLAARHPELTDAIQREADLRLGRGQ